MMFAKAKAEICLYGTSYCAGWLAITPDGKMYGTGEGIEGRSLTHAVFLACDELAQAGVRGQIAVFAPGGQQMALTDIRWPGYYSDLKWGPAPMLELSYEDIIEAANERNFETIPK